MLRIVLLTGLLLLPGLPGVASEWPQWRGPFFNGSTDEENLPSRWSQTENIAWTVDLAGVAAATPVVWADRVFLATTDASQDALQAMCVDRRTGRTLWRHDVARGIQKDDRSNFASASPVVDEQVAVFFYGSGDLVAYDHAGNRRWARNLQREFGPFAFLWTFSSSPLLLDGKLYLQVLQRDVPVEGRGLEGRENESYLLAIEALSGETLWRHVRPSKAVAESREAFTTPIPLRLDGQTQLLIAGGDALSGHDPQTGREIWRWETWNPQRIPHWRLVPSPVAGSGVILACAPKRDPIYAIRTGGLGQLGDRAVAWDTRDSREVSADVPTPAYYQDDFFVLSDVRNCLSRVEAATGNVKWTVPTPGRTKYEASPLAADGKLYLVNFDGQVAVFAAADGKLLATIPMDAPQNGEKVRSSISAAHGQLFLRTTRRLWCVGRTTESKATN